MVLLLSCKKPNRQANEITKVELARSVGWFNPGAAISIDSALNYNYWGVDSNKKPGYYSGKISQKFWDTLNQKLELIKYKTLPAHDSILLLDASYFELIVHWKNGKKRITTASASNPLVNTLLWLNSSYKNVKLRHVKYPIKFETNLYTDVGIFPPPNK